MIATIQTGIDRFINDPDDSEEKVSFTEIARKINYVAVVAMGISLSISNIDPPVFKLCLSAIAVSFFYDTYRISDNLLNALNTRTPFNTNENFMTRLTEGTLLTRFAISAADLLELLPNFS